MEIAIPFNKPCAQKIPKGPIGNSVIRFLTGGQVVLTLRRDIGTTGKLLLWCGSAFVKVDDPGRCRM